MVMRKNLLILTAVLAVSYSCSNDEVVETAATSDSNAISFRAFNTGVTRAADAHFNVAGDKFKATAFPTGTQANAFFTNVVFTTADGTTYTSEHKYYWPSSQNLDFWAYSPVSNAQITYTDYKTFTVQPSSTASEQVDLVYAKTSNWGKVDPDPSNGTAAGDEAHYIDGSPAGVTINFRHAESKVAVKLKNSNPNLKFTISDVTIGNLDGSGTFTYPGTDTDGQDAANISGGWAPSGSSSAYYSQTISNYDVTSSSVQQGVDMILIPQTLTKQTEYGAADAWVDESTTPNSYFKGPYISVNLTIQNNAADYPYIVGVAGSPVKAMWPLETIAWTPGKKYTYILDVADGGYYYYNQDSNADLDPILEGSEIKFVSVTVDSWDYEDYAIPELAYGTNYTFDTDNLASGTKTMTFEISGLAGGDKKIKVTKGGTDGADQVASTTPTLETATTESGTTETVTVTLNANAGVAKTMTITIQEYESDGTTPSGTATVITINQSAS